MFQSFINASSGRFGTQLKAKYPVAGGQVQSCFPGGIQVGGASRFLHGEMLKWDGTRRAATGGAIPPTPERNERLQSPIPPVNAPGSSWRDVHHRRTESGFGAGIIGIHHIVAIQIPGG
jgi:hypothetical protein